MLFLKNYLLFLLVLVVVSCSENTKNIPITGADVTLDSTTDDNSKVIDQVDNSQISVSDNAVENEKSEEEILIEELVILTIVGVISTA